MRVTARRAVRTRAEELVHLDPERPRDPLQGRDGGADDAALELGEEGLGDPRGARDVAQRAPARVADPTEPGADVADGPARRRPVVAGEPC
jgi:hypothetical protein